jgi:hypothetical protein
MRNAWPGLLLIALTLIVLAVIDQARARDAYHQRLIRCYSDGGCCLNPAELERLEERRRKQ